MVSWMNFFSNFKIVKIKISERISWHFIVIIKLFQFNKQCVTHSKCVWKILMIFMYFNLEVYKVLYTGYKVSKLFRIIIDNFHILLRFYGTKSSKCLTSITKRTSVITPQMFNVIWRQHFLVDVTDILNNASQKYQ